MMKKKLFFMLCLLLSSSAFCQEDNWLVHFISAEKRISENKIDQAILEYSLAIELSEGEKFHLLTGRARAHEQNSHFKEALIDYETALMQNQETINIAQALWGKARVELHLGLQAGWMSSYELVRKLDANFPQIHEDNDLVVWSNIDSAMMTAEFKEKFICSMVHMGICKTSDDVEFTTSGLCIVNKYHNCGCLKCQIEEMEGRFCGSCSQVIVPLLKTAADRTKERSLEGIYHCKKTFIQAQIELSNQNLGPDRLLGMAVAEICLLKCNADEEFCSPEKDPLKGFFERLK
jgi:tetratricopeptide (TPR) repeat protein